MTPRDPDILTAREAAALLGLGRDAVYEGARRGDIPCCKVGKRLLFSRTALVAWAHHRQAVPAEPAGAELGSVLEKLTAAMAELVVEIRAERKERAAERSATAALRAQLRATVDLFVKRTDDLATQQTSEKWVADAAQVHAEWLAIAEKSRRPKLAKNAARRR